MASLTPARRVAHRLSDLRVHGPQALATLPDEQQWAVASDHDRRRVLSELRIDLYALAALLAHAVVRCAIAERPSYPPYGLARSRFSEWGVISATPQPYEEGSLDSFYTLWTAFVDTMVFHLHAELSARRRSPQAWTVDGLERLLAKFAAVDDDKARARKRDAPTFVYGGLQFGTSFCVQLIEAETRALRRHAPDLSGQRCAEILARSSGPAYRLAALEFAQALSLYEGLLTDAADTPKHGRTTPGWLDADRFVVQRSHGQPWRVTLASADEPRPATVTSRLGCPARIAADDRDTPIDALWRWCVEVAGAAGLFESDEHPPV